MDWHKTQFFSFIVIVFLAGLAGCDEDIVHDGRTVVQNAAATGFTNGIATNGNSMAGELKTLYLRPGRNALSSLSAADAAAGVLFGVLDDEEKPCRGLSLVVAPSRGYFGKSGHHGSGILFDRNDDEIENDAIFFTCQGDDGEVHNYEVSLGMNPKNKSRPEGSVENIAVEQGTTYRGQIAVTDKDDDTLIFAVSKPGTLGALNLDQATGAFSYAAQPGAYGYDNVEVEVFDGKHTHKVEFTFLVVASIWQHPTNPLDVNDDGKITSADATAVINFLNRRSAFYNNYRPLRSRGYYDSSGDGMITPLDALFIINRLNREPEEDSPGPFTFSGDANFVNSRPTFSWTAAADANDVRYSVSISDSPSCEQPIMKLHPTLQRSATADALAEGVYYACNTAMDVYGNETIASNSPWQFSIRYKERAPTPTAASIPAGVVQKLHDKRKKWCGGGFESIWNGTQLFLWGGYAQNQALGQQVMIDREHEDLCQQGLIYDAATNQIADVPFLPERVFPNEDRYTDASRGDLYAGVTMLCPPGVRPHRTVDVCPRRGGQCSDEELENLYLCTGLDPYRLKGKGRMGHSVIWNGTGFVIWGGHRGHANLPGQQFQYWTYSLNDGWFFNPSTQQWTELNNKNGPRPRTGHVAAYLPQRDQMLIYGGWDQYNTVNFDDLDYKEDKLFGRGNTKVALPSGALYDFQTGNWINLPPGGPPVLADSRLVVSVDGDGHAVFHYEGDNVFYILEFPDSNPKWVLEVR